jgi:hypothetical protein
MWTTRRILLAFGTFVVLGASFLSYNLLFGSVDGLPPLPKAYAVKVTGTNDDAIPIEPLESNPTLRRIIDAFGRDCDEKHYPVKIDSRAKGFMVLGELLPPEPDGRWQLSPCSLVIFGKQKSPNDPVEISTIHCDRAFIRFDKPVVRLADMEGRRIVSAELRSDPEVRLNDPRKGYVHVTNNRKSLNPNDGLAMRTVGPIYYVAEPKLNEPHIHSDAPLEATDRQNLPPANSPDAAVRLPTVTATGMRLFLNTDENPKDGKTPVAPKKAGAQPSISGVEKIELLANVTMNLWIDRSSNFLGGPGKENPKTEPAKKDPKDGSTPEGRSLLQVHTDGPFFFLMNKDLARFEHAPRTNPNIPNYVQVTRHLGRGNLRDMMTSDFLEIQFKRQPKDAKTKVATTPESKKAQPENQMQVDTVHGWGDSVALTSDSEDLDAFGNDLFHDETNKQTILKGSPVRATKEGNHILAAELILAGLDNRDTQQARVKGPGQIDMGQVDPATGKFVYVRQARWEDWLVYSKVNEGGKMLDVMTLTGGSTFVDTLNGQFLSARQLKVWLKGPRDNTQVKEDPKNPPKKSEKKQSTPTRIEATSEVLARSPDLEVKNTDYLNIWFREMSSSVGPGAPESAPVPRMSTVPGKDGTTVAITPKKDIVAPTAKTEPSKDAALAPKVNVDPKAKAKLDPKSKEPVKQNPPIQVSCRKMETWVKVVDGKNELDRVRCEDRVQIHQDPANPGERGIDIQGRQVDLKHEAEGHELIVLGTQEDPGQVHFDQLSMLGKEIQIDQRNNSATIKQPGTMKILSSTNLQGDKLERPRYITIHWQVGMEFRGSDKWVRYEGSVQAEQDNAKVACQSMQVTLDREVYLNQLDRGKAKASPSKKPGGKEESAKVEFVVCDNAPPELPGVAPKAQLSPVTMIDTTVKEGLLLRQQTIEAPQLNLDNVKSEVVSSGPGIVRIYQPGPKNQNDPGPAPKAKGNQPKAEEEMKLTEVKYSSRMKANNLQHTAIFYGEIDAIHVAANSPDMKLIPTQLPEGAIRLRCKNRLEVFTQQVDDAQGKKISYQNMNASGNVVVYGDDYSAESDEVKYEEAKDQIIFTGTKERPAIIYKIEVVGEKPKSFKGVKINYNRKTKQIDVTEGLGLQAN